MADFKEYRDFRQFLGVRTLDLLTIPFGTTAQRPTGTDLEKSLFRYNETLDNIEFYNGTVWKQPASSSANDLTQYQIAVGNASNKIGSSSNLTFDNQYFIVATSTPATILQLVNNTAGIGSISQIQYSNHALTLFTDFDHAVLNLSQSSAQFPQLTGTGTQMMIIGPTGTIGRQDIPSVIPYTDESAQDAIGSILTGSSSISFTYNDALPSITASVNNSYIRGLLNLTNGLTYNNTTGVGELGGTLNKTTTLGTGNFIMRFSGESVFDYPYQFYQNQYFQNGSGVASFLSHGHNTLAPNTVRLGINYTGDTYQNTPTFIPGYFGDRIGYFLGTNVTGHGSFGLYVDDPTAKNVGVFFHVHDHTYTDAITLYGGPADSNGTSLSNSLNTRKILTGHTDKNITLWGYPSSRNDGTTSKALYVGTNGELLYGNIAGGGSETDPIFSASAAFGITNTDKTNWTSAYNDKIVGASFSGINTQTLTLTQQDGGTVTASFDSKIYVIEVNSTIAGNVGTSATDLSTITLPAGLLANDGDTIEFEYIWKFAANGNSKNFSVQFGSEVILGITTTAIGDYTVRGSITRLSATTQRVMWFGAGNSISSKSQTLSGALVLKTTGTGGATDDVIFYQSRLKFVGK